jgi:hypothetical protein
MAMWILDTQHLPFGVGRCPTDLYNEEQRHGWSSWVKVFHVFSKEGRYSLTTMVDCSLIQYPSTTIVPDTMWMGLWGVVGVFTSCEASIGTVCSSLEVIMLFWARISVPPMVDCHFPMNYSFLYLPSYNIRCLTMNSGGLLLSRDRIGRKRLNQPSRQATKRVKVSNQ